MDKDLQLAMAAYQSMYEQPYEPEGEEIDEIDEATKVTRIRGEFKKPQPLNPLPKSSRKSGMEKLEQGRKAFNKSKEVASRNLMRQKSNEEFELDEADSVAAMRERAAKRRQQRYGKQGGGGRDDFRPYTKADYERGEKESTKKESFDIFDTILEYLVAEGYADTNESALVIMANMSEEWRQSIVEQEGFRSDGRYQLPDGRTMGSIPGAFRSLFTGNLPKSRTYIPPSTQTPTNRPAAVPASKDDSGKLTDFGKGGGRKKMQQTGMTVGQVERLGRRNVGDYSN